MKMQRRNRRPIPQASDLDRSGRERAPATTKALGSLLRFAGEVAAETLWPTRCALCDLPGEVLCPQCERALPYIDLWRTCPDCGSPFGRVQCDLCNPVMQQFVGRTDFPLADCASAVLFRADTGQLVRSYKDQGEQRLARTFAKLMVRSVSPDWPVDAVTFIPASAAAVAHRGFDHGQLLAQAVAECLQVPWVSTLERPATKDQRALSATRRVENLSGRFRLRADSGHWENLLLVDDVMTTGSTLCTAAQALSDGAASQVFGLTFARV